MDTASLQFLAFGLGVALISNFSKSPVWRSSVLFAASIVFLILLSKNPLVLLPLCGFLALAYIALALIRRGCSKSSTWSVFVVLCAYGWMKKYSFLPEGTFVNSAYLTLGLSYIFFRVLHLVIESGDGAEKRHIGPVAYLLYTLNFTTFVSGPIQRYDEFARDQFASMPIPLGPRAIGLQMERIVRGFFKVNVLATLLHTVHEDVLAQMSQPLPGPVKMVAACELILVYPLFLYANFSGYIDIVIALARLMRLRLPENFDRPFAASSILEFWNRWHITLSSWFKSYVYNPLLLALMRRIPSAKAEPILGVFCFFVTFFLVGAWHGRSSEFLVFGVLTGAGISINKLWQLELMRFLGRKGYKEWAKNDLYKAVGRGLTFGWFGFTLFWFWGEWKQLDQVFPSLGMAQWVGVGVVTWLCATAALEIWERLRSWLGSIATANGPVLANRYALVVYASAMGLTALVMTFFLNQPAPGIVYKAF